MSVFESIADRRIRAGREEGLFDNLSGAGKPISDLGEERPPGWWAERLVNQERQLFEAEEREHSTARSAPPDH